MEVILLIFLFPLLVGLFAGSGGKRSGSKGGPIIGTGRSPMYYDIMEEAHTDTKAELVQRAKDGKNSIMTHHKWCSTKKGFVQVGEPKTVTAQEILDDFLEYERRGYM